MYREIEEKLKVWNDNGAMKPLIINGARQVGKSYSMKEFGKKYFKNMIYVNFDFDTIYRNIFKINKNPEKIIENLSLYMKTPIYKNDTLIVFDEIQFCEEALNSLKYFYEETSGYKIIAAGSLLGTYLKNVGSSYPVGCVETLSMYPMTFNEFLCAIDKKIFDIFINFDFTESEFIYHDILNDYYKKYLLIGGMPEAVSTYIETKDITKVQKVQDDIIKLYENDISKYNGKIDSAKMLSIIRAIPQELAKVNKKFQFNNVKSGSRFSQYENCIEWLRTAGLIIPVYNINKIETPLKVYRKNNIFKLYFFDVGLLCKMSNVDVAKLMGDVPFQFNGAIAENYVLQQLHSREIEVYYFSNNQMEIDFIYEDKNGITPIEVKAGKNINSTSFKHILKKYNFDTAYRISMLPYKKQECFVDIPMYSC